MYGCGPGGTCCGSCQGLAGLEAPLPVTPYPNTTQVLYDYVVRMLQAKQPFYITDQVNSDVLSLDGMGFFAEIFAAVASAAAAVMTVAPKVAEVAAVVNSVSGSSGKSSTPNPTADQIAAAVLPQVQAQLAAKGVQLPPAVAQQTVTASLLDAFGSQNRQWVIMGGLGLGVLLLVKLLRR